MFMSLHPNVLKLRRPRENDSQKLFLPLRQNFIILMDSPLPLKQRLHRIHIMKRLQISSVSSAFTQLFRLVILKPWLSILVKQLALLSWRLPKLSWGMKSKANMQRFTGSYQEKATSKAPPVFCLLIFLFSPR